MKDTSYESWYNQYQVPGESYDDWLQHQGNPPRIIREAPAIVPPPVPDPPKVTNTNTNTNAINQQSVINALGGAAGGYHMPSGDPWGKGHAGGVPYGGAKWFKHLLGTFGVNY